MRPTMRPTRKLLANPYAIECVKSLIRELDPRGFTQVESWRRKYGAFPEKYTKFDQFIAWHLSVHVNKKKARTVKLSHQAIALVSLWRAQDYPLPLPEPLLTALSLLPFNTGLKAVIVKDALIKQGYMEKELRKPTGSLRTRAKKLHSQLEIEPSKVNAWRGFGYEC